MKVSRVEVIAGLLQERQRERDKHNQLDIMGLEYFLRCIQYLRIQLYNIEIYFNKLRTFYDENIKYIRINNNYYYYKTIKIDYNLKQWCVVNFLL